MAIVVVDSIPEAAPPTEASAAADAVSEAREAGALAAALDDGLAFSLPPAGVPAPAAALGGASFAAGVPLDFVFYARQKYPEETEEGAVAKLLQEIQTPPPEVNLESVVAAEIVEGASLFTHPCLYADPDAIDDLERIPEPWLARVSAHREGVERILRAVGRIQIHHYVPRGVSATGLEVGLVVGTGFVVAPRIVMTNRHVAEVFAMARDDAFPFLKDGRGEQEPVVLIDFGGVYDEQQNVHRIERVLFIARRDEPDVALLELRETPGRAAPEPVPMQLTAPAADALPREAFAVGYPTFDQGDARVPLFFRLLRVKRVSLGRMSRLGRWEGMPRLFHDCTTLGGSSGSPLADLGSGAVWGLHFHGQKQTADGSGNVAEPIWRLAELPAIGDVLRASGASDAPSFSVLETSATGPGFALAAAPAPAATASRPVLFVEGADFDDEQPFPTDWFAPGSPEHERIRATLPAVGLVQSQDRTGATVAAATGFLVAPDVLLTFPVPWQTPRKTNKKPGVFVDFARTVANEPPRRFRAIAELYRDDVLLLLRLETPADHPLPAPLPPRRERPDGPLVAERIFLVGHPAAAGAALGDPAAASRMFPPPYGVKRVALGLLGDAEPGEQPIAGSDVRHDCSTTVGDGGAPLVSLISGEVLGMHLGGAFGRGNFGVSIRSTLEKREIASLLG